MDKALSNAARERIESPLTAARIVELGFSPVKGNFDAAHLREVNRYIFQDLPGAGITDVTPGGYRPPTPAGEDWLKIRILETKEGIFTAAYSKMDDESQQRLDETLAQIDINKFRELSTEVFCDTISDLYAELDYIHPFNDGNTRTLTTFTRQIARECGFELDWQRIYKDAASRDALYIARDLSVNELAAPHTQHPNTVRYLHETHAQLKTNRKLPDLLRDAVSRTQEQYLALPHIDKMANLLAKNNPVGEHVRHEELVDKFKSQLGKLFEQGNEISRSEVERYEAHLHSGREVSREMDLEHER